jgi:pyrimidine operon attenuation protein / uracil phosphoribosyltransferase
MSLPNSVILNGHEIDQKIRRIAFQVYERNAYEKEILVVGIADTGYEIARTICEELEKISPFQRKDDTLTLLKINLNKFSKSQDEANVKVEDETPQSFLNKPVILVDDVLNTGRTLSYCLTPFLSYPIKKLETAVLVNRSHSLFPVQITYTGLELATTLEEHINVVLNEKERRVYLS